MTGIGQDLPKNPILSVNLGQLSSFRTNCRPISVKIGKSWPILGQNWPNLANSGQILGPDLIWGATLIGLTLARNSHMELVFEGFRPCAAPGSRSGLNLGTRGLFAKNRVLFGGPDIVHTGNPCG